MLTVNELSSAEVEADFNDSVGSPTLPTTAYWKAHCVTTDTALTDWAEVSVQTESDDAGNVIRHYVYIEVPSTVNAIQRPVNRYEIKEVVIVANKDLDNEFNEPYQYRVVNTSRA